MQSRNTLAGKLLGGIRFTGTVSGLLGGAKVGEVKEEVPRKD